MSWLFYLLEANLYMLIFYGFYRLFLQHETFYNSNRYYLLGTSFISFLLPILQVGLLKPAEIAVETFEAPINYGEEYLVAQPVQETLHFTSYLYPIYLCIAACFAIKLGIDVSKIINLWLKAKKQRSGAITVIELKDQAAFSFFNLLFIHPQLAEKKAVFNHEMVHIKQKHSFDILLFEFLQIICWFNPIIYFIKKDIKLLHEYIADELSTSADMQKHEYAMFLIENSFGITPTALTNQIFNQSILKSRINMLNKKRTAGWARLKLLLALPLVGGMLCTSTVAFTKDYGYVDLLPEKSIATISMIQDPPTGENVKKQAPTTKSIKKDKAKLTPPKSKIEKPSAPPFKKDQKPEKQLKFAPKFDGAPPSPPRSKKDETTKLSSLRSERTILDRDTSKRLKFRTERDTVYKRKHIDSLHTVRLRLAPTRALKREDDRIRTTIKRDSVRTIKVRPSRIAPIKREVELRIAPTKVKEPNININNDEVKEVRINQKVTEVAIVPKKAPAHKLAEISIVPKKAAPDKVIEVVVPTQN